MDTFVDEIIKISDQMNLSPEEKFIVFNRAMGQIYRVSLELRASPEQWTEERIAAAYKTTGALGFRTLAQHILAEREGRDQLKALDALKDLLHDLFHMEGVRGKTIEESIQLVKDTEKEMEDIPANSYKSTLRELISTSDIQSETLKALLTSEPTWESLNKQAKEWKEKIRELKKTIGILEEQVRKTDAIFDRLNKPLILSREQEELSLLYQKIDQTKSRLATLTIESLGSELNEVKRTLTGLAQLTQTLPKYDQMLNKLQDLIEKNNQQLEAIENNMKAAATRQEYPLLWTRSRMAFEEIMGNLASIPPLSERRTLEELATNLDTAKACEKSLTNLQERTDKVVVDLDLLSQLLEQLRYAYTNEWLSGAEQLFSEMKKYDMDVNWEPADHARSLFSDANQLIQQANENIPFSTSIPIYEQQVDPRLFLMKELAIKKPLFDARMARIETRLKEMQEGEKEAVSLHMRIAPVVSLFAKNILWFNIPIRSAKDMLAAEVTRVELEKSLAQWDKGNVSMKLQAVRMWERNTAENGVRVCRWVEDDLLKRRVSISAILREIEVFAEDLLTADIVVQAYKYDLVFAPHLIDVQLLKKQSLDVIQENAVKLFNEYQEVIEFHGELRKLIAPVDEGYNEMLEALKRLQINCSVLEIRLGRDWPPVFQSANRTRAKIDKLTRDIRTIWKRKWKPDELLMYYSFLWKRIHDLKSEVDHLRQLDEQQAAGMWALEKEYKTTVNAYSRLMDARNELLTRTEMNSGDIFLKTLIEIYRNGRKNGIAISSALKVKEQMQRKTEEYKQLIENYELHRGE